MLNRPFYNNNNQCLCRKSYHSAAAASLMQLLQYKLTDCKGK